jgi:hypothetical protein
LLSAVETSSSPLTKSSPGELVEAGFRKPGQLGESIKLHASMFAWSTDGSVLLVLTQVSETNECGVGGVYPFCQCVNSVRGARQHRLERNRQSAAGAEIGCYGAPFIMCLAEYPEQDLEVVVGLCQEVLRRVEDDEETSSFEPAEVVDAIPKGGPIVAESRETVAPRTPRS